MDYIGSIKLCFVMFFVLNITINHLGYEVFERWFKYSSISILSLSFLIWHRFLKTFHVNDSDFYPTYNMAADDLTTQWAMVSEAMTLT